MKTAGTLTLLLFMFGIVLITGQDVTDAEPPSHEEVQRLLKSTKDFRLLFVTTNQIQELERSGAIGIIAERPVQPAALEPSQRQTLIEFLEESLTTLLWDESRLLLVRQGAIYRRSNWSDRARGEDSTPTDLDQTILAPGDLLVIPRYSEND